MPDEVKKIVQERLKETAKDREAAFDPSDMYLDDLKKNFGSVMSLDSRNTSANRSNKPIASQLAKGQTGSQQSKIRILSHADNENDSDEDDDDDVLGRGREDLQQSFGKKGGGLAQLKAKLSLQEELGALKSELSDFDNKQSSKTAAAGENKQQEDAAWNAVKDMDSVQERDGADDLDDSDDDDDDEMDDGGRLTAKDLISMTKQEAAVNESSDTSASSDTATASSP